MDWKEVSWRKINVNSSFVKLDVGQTKNFLTANQCIYAMNKKETLNSLMKNEVSEAYTVNIVLH